MPFQTQMLKNQPSKPIELNPASLKTIGKDTKSAMIVAAQHSKKSPATFVELDVRLLDKLFQVKPRQIKKSEISGAFP
uniref:Uncharacterized protein n=1 Tax=Panagrolaimus sp. JU765 TaxID=591449 RepID=A0AC34R246_9BILA